MAIGKNGTLKAPQFSECWNKKALMRLVPWHGLLIELRIENSDIMIGIEMDSIENSLQLPSDKLANI